MPVSSSGEASALINRLPASSRAYLVKVPLCLFLDPVFILSHIKRGQLVALSKGKLDTDDVFCLDGSGECGLLFVCIDAHPSFCAGVLHLSLTRDSYQTLGIVGQALKQSRTSSGKSRGRLSGKYERWMVRIDLVAASFIPGKPGFDRTLARLKEWDERKAGEKSDSSLWNVLFCWTDAASPGGSVMHFPPRHVSPDAIVEIDTRPTVTTTEDCWVPLLPPRWARGWSYEPRHTGQMDWVSWHEELETLLEWNGLASLSADCMRTFARTDHLNSYEVASPEARQAGSIVKLQYRGLLSSDLCSSVLQSVQSYLFERNKGSFAVVSCSGFMDSPIAWKMDPEVPPAQWQDVSSSSEDSDEEDDLYDLDLGNQTGQKARRKRQKQRAKRGTICRHQVGYQVKLPGSSNCNGWTAILLDRREQEQSEYVLVENVGGCLKC